MFAPPIKAPKSTIVLSAASLRGGEPNGHREPVAHPERTAVSQAARSLAWDFSKIPIFAARASEPISHLNPLVPPKPPSGQAVNPLEPDRGRIPDRMPNAATPEARSKRPDRDLAAERAPEAVYATLRSPGQPLDASARAYFEPRLGHDLSRVRIHTDEPAAKSARAVQAAAYTVGRDIVFGAGRYTPETGEGRRLLAHEIVHSVQQGIVAGPTAARRLEMSQPGNAAEREASRIAAGISSGAGHLTAGPSRQPIGIGRSPLSIQRDIVGSQDLSTGRFEVNFKKHDGVADAADARVDDSARAGEQGMMTFTPKPSAPQSNQIRFLQVARLTETASGELHQFGGSQAPLNEMRSQPGEYAEGGFSSIHNPTPPTDEPGNRTCQWSRTTTRPTGRPITGHQGQQDRFQLGRRRLPRGARRPSEIRQCGEVRTYFDREGRG